jgi:formylglycine-generating enzyme required for sulfatase activity
MAYVPGGRVQIGQSVADRENQAGLFDGLAADYRFAEERDVLIPAFLIDRHEVTQSRYVQYVKDLTEDSAAMIQLRESCPSTVSFHTVEPDNPYEPASYVSIREASIFCETQGKRLPTFEEWELAAQGANGTPFPWGFGLSSAGAYNAGDIGSPLYRLVLSPLDGFAMLAPVMAMSAGASSWRVEGLGGNVSEWVFGPDGRALSPPYFHRGGGFLSHPLFLSTYAYQLVSDPCARYTNIGFRCAKDVFPVDSEGRPL